MANDLVKEKTLIEFIPGTPDDPGDPGSPAEPQRVTYEKQDVRVEASTSTMTRISPGVWQTPLDALRIMAGDSKITAAQAHYSDAWQTVEGPSGAERVPVAWSSAWVIQRKSVKVIVPAKPAVPPRPPKPGSKARSVYDMHFGWNAGAHSLRVLPVDWVGTAKFTIKRPTGGVVGFATEASVPNSRVTSFAHIKFGVTVGDGQIRLREDGVNGKVLGPMTGNDVVEALINKRSVEWRINGTTVYTGPFTLATPFVLDAVLYAGGDEVNDPSLVDGVDSTKNLLAMAPLKINATALEPLSFRLKLGRLNMMGSDYNVCQGALAFRPLTVPLGGSARGTLNLRRLAVLATDASTQGIGQMTTAPMRADGVMEGGESTWVPKYSIGNLGMLPVTAAGGILSGQTLDGTPALQPLDLMASQDAYGEARLRTLPLSAVGDAEAITPLIRAQDLVGAVPTAEAVAYITLVMAESIGAGTTAPVAAITFTAQAQEQIGASSTSSATARMLAAALDVLGLAEKHLALTFQIIDGQPVLVDDGQAWVVNTDSGATTRYESYGFNSYAGIAGKHFGAMQHGIYELGGSTDAGQPISAGVSLGKHDFGTQALKHIDAVYAGVSATGQLLLRVGDGRNSYTYKARRVDADMRTQRFDPGRGLRANYFTFDLLNEDGGEFDLDKITFSSVVTKRKI